MATNHAAQFQAFVVDRAHSEALRSHASRERYAKIKREIASGERCAPGEEVCSWVFAYDDDYCPHCRKGGV